MSGALNHLRILGIGLEVHEQPYLQGGTHDIIQTGHTFSNEPGIYIEGQVRDLLALSEYHGLTGMIGGRTVGGLLLYKCGRPACVLHCRRRRTG